MKAQELRDMSIDEVGEKVREFRESLFNLKFQHATGQLENTAQLKKTKRDVARAISILNAKTRAAEGRE